MLRLYLFPRALSKLGLKVWPNKRRQIFSYLGFLFEREGNFEKAIACYEEAKALDSQDGMLYWDLACVYEQQGNLPLVLENYEKALELSDDVGEEFKSEVQDRILRLKAMRDI